MVVVNGCRESQSWSVQCKYSESKPCNQCSHDDNLCLALPRKFVHFMRRCEIQTFKHLRFGSMSVSPWPFREPRTVVAYGLRSKWGHELGLPTNLQIQDQGRHVTVFHLLLYAKFSIKKGKEEKKNTFQSNLEHFLFSTEAKTLGWHLGIAAFVFPRLPLVSKQSSFLAST